MQLDVSKALSAPGTEISFEGALSLAPTALVGEPVAFLGPAFIKGHYASLGSTITVRGELTFTASAQCMRCLADSEHSFSVDFDERFALMEDENNPDLYLYEGGRVDLQQMADDAAVLSLPMQWRCSDACRGLCPMCGADLNTTQCTCRTEEKITSLSALKTLLAADAGAENALGVAEDEREV